jgi:hypothetical protein
LNEARRFNDRTPPNSAGSDKTHVRFEDHYLVSGMESKSDQTPTEVESARNEALQFHNFDFNVLGEDEWIDFGDTCIGSF